MNEYLIGGFVDELEKIAQPRKLFSGKEKLRKLIRRLLKETKKQVIVPYEARKGYPHIKGIPTKR